MRFIGASLFCLFVLVNTNVRAQQTLWTSQIGSEHLVNVGDIESTASGDFIVVGLFKNELTFGDATGNDTTIVSARQQNRDCFIVKFNIEGRLIWATSFERREGDENLKVASGPDGEIYVAGSYHTKLAFAVGTDREIILESVRGFGIGLEAFLAKFNAEGEFEWARVVSGFRNNNVDDLGVDSGGNIIMSGNFEKSATFFNGDTTQFELQGEDPDSQADKAYVVKYDKEGELLWAKAFVGLADEFVEDIMIGKDGEVLVAGKFLESISFPDIGTNRTTFHSQGGADGFLVKLDASGNTLWAIQVAGTSVQEVRTLTFGRDENIYISGIYRDSTFFGEGEHRAMLGNSVNDYTQAYVAKYDSEGVFAWARNVASNVEVQHLVSNSVGELFLAGEFFFDSSVQTSSSEEMLLVGWSLADIFYAKLNPEGILEWVETVGGSEDDTVTDVVVDIEDNVLLLGRQRGNIFVDSGDSTETELSAIGDLNSFIIKLNPLTIITAAERNQVNEDAVSSTLFPNPFSQKTTLQLELKRAGLTSIKIYDALGRIRESMALGFMPAGRHQIYWQPSNLSNGIYFIAIEAGEGHHLRVAYYLK